MLRATFGFFVRKDRFSSLLLGRFAVFGGGPQMNWVDQDPDEENARLFAV
jgi:hypothetical protein